MAADRSFTIILINNTGHTLVRTGSGLDGGIWSASGAPPDRISAGATISWGSESDGFMRGTAGSATYDIGADSSQQLVISWDNPYWGSNSNSVTCPDAYTTTTEGGSGDTASLTVTLAPAS